MISCPVNNKKLVYDPLWGLIDITEFIPLIDIPEFQSLGFKYQLGTTNFLFPAATHTRKQHSLGALKRTQDLAKRWVAMGFINKAESRMIEAFALWHDLGHGPFSHVVEEVTKEIWGRDHDENGERIIGNLRPVVESAGIDFKKFQEFFDHTNPLYLAVHDKNLGTEKLDYLSRDAFYTLGEKPGIEYLGEHTYFLDGEVLIDEKAIDNAKLLQDFYVRMYKMVYLRKNAAIGQRLLQRITAKLLEIEEFNEQDFWSLTDFGLLGHLENAKSDDIKKEVKRFLNRDFPRTTIALKLSRFAGVESGSYKSQKVLGIADEQMLALLKSPELQTPSAIRKLEVQLEKNFKLPENSILISPSNSMHRFVPKEVKIYNPHGSPHRLSDYFKDHFKSIEEEGQSYTVVRICTYPEFRDALAKDSAAAEIKEFMLGIIQD